MQFYPRCHALLSVVLDGRGGADTAPLMVETTPISARVCRNGYHDADTWSLEFDARAMPFDPDLIRSAAAFIYMYAAESMDDRREWAVPDFEMIRGLADDASISLSEDGQTLSMEGRDYTGLLLDAEWDPKDRIPAGRPLDETIQAIADAAAPPGTRARFEVEYRSADVPPVVGRAHRSTKKKGLWVKPGKSYWDVIYEMAISHGHIAYVDGETIVIDDPNVQTELTLKRAPQLVYGRNLDSLEVSRHLTKEKVPQIKMVAYDPRSGERVEVLYPEKGEKVTNGLGDKKDEILVLPAPKGIGDRDTLRRIARARHANLGRAEASYRAETCNLESLDGQDLLLLKAGSPISIAFDPFNLEQMRALATAQRVEHMVQLGYSQKLAAFVAERYDRLDQFRQPYYLTEAEYSWSVDDGLQISIEAKNYAYEARERAKEAA